MDPFRFHQHQHPFFTIQNGVKHTEWNGSDLPTHKIEDAIQNGVKHTEDGDWLDGDERFEDIIKDGVKNAQFGYLRDPWVIKISFKMSERS